ncbi:DUF5681 domain-containing protein [Microvirga makkahensis]|uniref:DUF5681 domain-containing protein n=1 Tax=Microvirga makkahensis TaxID=1128670 RepID=UPI00197CA832
MSTRKGVWKPGQSGNPKGRPSIKGEVETLARTYTVEALETLADLMRNGASDSVRMAAANALLNRGWGLPRQAIDGSLALAPAPPKPVNRMTLEEIEAELAMLEEEERLAKLEEEEERLALVEGSVEVDCD